MSFQVPLRLEFAGKSHCQKFRLGYAAKANNWAHFAAAAWREHNYYCTRAVYVHMRIYIYLYVCTHYFAGGSVGD